MVMIGNYLSLHVNLLDYLMKIMKIGNNIKKDKASINETDILNKIELRNKARKNKDYKEADRIRNELLDKGVLIEDKDGKTIWKFK